MTLACLLPAVVLGELTSWLVTTVVAVRIISSTVRLRDGQSRHLAQPEQNKHVRLAKKNPPLHCT